MHEAVGGKHRPDSGHPDGVRDDSADNGREARPVDRPRRPQRADGEEGSDDVSRHGTTVEGHRWPLAAG
jgi:hypothetical protein